MDRSTIKVQESTTLEVTLPNGEATDFRMELCSLDDQKPRQVLKKWDRIASKSKKGLSFEQKEQAANELMAACILSWTGYTENGTVIECSEEEKMRIVSDRETRFVREQIDEKLGDVNSFLAVSSERS